MTTAYILADNGVSSGSAGIKTGGGDDGKLVLQTSTSGGTATTAVTIDNAQNMGLGVTPSAWGSYNGALDLKGGAALGGYNNSTALFNNSYYNGTNYIYKASTGAAFYQMAGNAHQWYIAPSGTAGNTITFTQAMTLDTSGRLMLGANQSNAFGGNLELVNGVSYNSSAAISLVLGGTDNGYVDIGRASTYRMTVTGSAGGQNLSIDRFLRGTGWTNSAVFDSSGNLLVGTTSQILAARTSVYGGGANGGAFQTGAAANTYTAIACSRNGNDGNAAEFWWNTSTQVGTVKVTSTATTYNTSSDYRLKNITGPVTGEEAKTFIMALQPKQGTWKADGSRFVGFLAHEFQTVSPSSVNGEKDAVDAEGNAIYQGMQASSPEVMANLIALVQEQQAIIEQLRADVAQLKGAQA